MINKLITGLLLLICNSLLSQSVSQLTITPSNPTPNDTIYIISTLTYSGNCSYGLVGTYTSSAGNTLSVMPVYCGYGSTTTCVSTDTFKLAPLAVGYYNIVMEYHQGSVCPLSGFDATIANASTTVSVQSLVTGLNERLNSQTGFKAYPNPAREIITLEIPESLSASTAVVQNLLGEVLYCKQLSAGTEQLHLGHLAPGIYVVELEGVNKPASRQRIILR